MRRRARTLTVLSVAVAVVVVAGPAVADYPPQSGVVVDADVVVENPDATVRVEGEDWSGDTVIEIRYEDADGTVQTLGEVETDPDGGFETAVALPDDVDPADVTFTVAEAAGGSGAAQTFQLTSSSTDASGTEVAQTDTSGDDAAADTLANTGAPAGAMLLAVALLAAGLVTLAGARRMSQRLPLDG